MSKSIKLNNDTFWDSSAVSHNKKSLNDILNNVVCDYTLPENKSYMSIPVALEPNAVYRFELSIVFIGAERNVFLVPNGLWENNNCSYSFITIQSSEIYKEQQTSASRIGLGLANSSNDYWSVFTGTIDTSYGRFNIFSQSNSINGSSVGGGRYNGDINIASLTFISADWKDILAGAKFKMWKVG